MKKSLILYLALFIAFLDWMGIGLVYPIFSTMIFHPDYSILDPLVSEMSRGWYLGVLLASMSVAEFFSSPILGSLSDQKGRRPILVVSILLGSIGYLFCVGAVLIKSFALLITARCLVGIGAGNAAVVSATIADLSDESNKTKRFGLYSMACGVGFTIGPFLGGVFGRTNFALPFSLAGVVTFISFVLVYFFFKETHHKRKSAKISWNEGIRNLKKAFKIQELKLLFLLLFLFCFGWSFFYEFIPVSWISNFKLDSKQIGFFYAYGSAVYALSAGVLIRPIVNRFKQHNILFFSLLFMGLGIIAITFNHSSYLVWVYIPIVNFLAALMFPTLMSLVSGRASDDSQGEVLGIYLSIQAVSFAIAPLAGAILLGAGPFMSTLVGGLSILLGSFALGRFLKKERV